MDVVRGVEKTSDQYKIATTASLQQKITYDNAEEQCY